MSRLEEKLYQEYTTFFEKAERERRWNVFDDIPWTQVNRERDRGAGALRRDVLLGGDVPARLRGRRHQRRAQVLRPGLVPGQLGLRGVQALARADAVPAAQSGKRTEEQMVDLQNRIFEKKWDLPFNTPRQMTFYGCVQEMATFVIYVKHRERAARREGDAACGRSTTSSPATRSPTCRFYQGVIKVLLEEDREGTLADMAHVFANFEMPGVGLVPDYDARILKMRDGGDRSQRVHPEGVHADPQVPRRHASRALARQLFRAARARGRDGDPRGDHGDLGHPGLKSPGRPENRSRSLLGS